MTQDLLLNSNSFKISAYGQGLLTLTTKDGACKG